MASSKGLACLAAPSLTASVYSMLSGTSPFSEDRRIQQELKEQILIANYTFYPQLCDNIPVEAKDPIQKCPKLEPFERIKTKTSFTSTNVKLRLRFDVHLTFT